MAQPELARHFKLSSSPAAKQRNVRAETLSRQCSIYRAEAGVYQIFAMFLPLRLKKWEQRSEHGRCQYS
ncbi:hypothetical protein WJ16_04290 [Burkholderia metallica]|nr:hypothetical protein WJ16_04290 [Burkholderia metallica]